MRRNATTIMIGLLLLAGCGTSSNGLKGGVYTSPNGGFTYKVPQPDLIDKVRENILANGGNVQFFQWTHFKRIDYANLSPTVEQEIQDKTFHEQLLRDFTMGTFVPGIAQFVPKAEVREATPETVGDTPVFYVSMFMPKASTKSLNGKKLDACRCLLTHTNGKRVYVFTVSAGIDPRSDLPPEEVLAKTEEWLKGELLTFLEDVRIQ